MMPNQGLREWTVKDDRVGSNEQVILQAAGDLDRLRWEAQEARDNEELELRKRQFDFEREKWKSDNSRAQEELKLRGDEVAAKLDEIRRARWSSPLVLSVLAASVAAASNAYIALMNADNQRSLEANKSAQTRDFETEKAELARIQEAVKDPCKAAASINALLEAGLVTDLTRRTRLTTYVSARSKPSSECPGAISAPTPSLPSTSSTSTPSLPSTRPSTNTNVAQTKPATVTHQTGWLGGGHTQAQACQEGQAKLSPDYPGKTLLVLTSGESSKKDFFGRVEYQYYCTFEIR